LFLPVSLTVLPVQYDSESDTEKEHYQRLCIHRLRCIANPFFSLAAYILVIFPSCSITLRDMRLLIAYLAISSIISAWMYLTTSATKKPMFHAVHVAYAFCTCLLWMYLICNELVSVLSTLGYLLGISESTMGVLVLAIGNSLGDLAANLSVCRRGSMDVALSAVLMSPIQNSLLTMGISLAIAVSFTEDHNIPLDLWNGIILTPIIGSILSVSTCLALACYAYKYSVPRFFGALLIGIFVIHVPLMIYFGFS